MDTIKFGVLFLGVLLFFLFSMFWIKKTNQSAGLTNDERRDENRIESEVSDAGSHQKKLTGKLKIVFPLRSFKKVHAISKWKWDVDDELCGICR
jgi:hypothetical protein